MSRPRTDGSKSGCSADCMDAFDRSAPSGLELDREAWAFLHVLSKGDTGSQDKEFARLVGRARSLVARRRRMDETEYVPVLPR